MTGHGQALTKLDQFTIEVEVRTVNNRFLKVVSKLSDLASSLEPEMEGIVRDFVKRGSVSLNVQVTSVSQGTTPRINQSVLRSYIEEATRAADSLMCPYSVDLGNFLLLPDVIEKNGKLDDEDLIESIRQTVRDALSDLQSMRRREGCAMQAKFKEHLTTLASHHASIETRAPSVVSEYRLKLEQRVRTAVEERGLQLGDADLTREIVLFCDKSDISEELTRLASHLLQFELTINQDESQGRRLDFLLQEMGRETNTIGSKANDSEIAVHVVSMKTILEQIRELAQNIE